MRRDMKPLKSDLKQELKAITKVASTSWFRGTPHRWPDAAIPLAYAMACVEVVSKSSEKARILYSQIVECWGKPEIKAYFEKVRSIIPDSEKEEIKQTFIHPENALLPDPNKPFKDLEEIGKGLEINEEVIKDDKNFEEILRFIDLISEFVKVGFNHESDIEKGRIRVTLSGNVDWLTWAILITTSLEYQNISLESVRKFYKVRKYKGKVVDFHRVLTEKPMSRMHRKMTAGARDVNLKLKNDRIFIEAANIWYQCRVIYPSINKFLDSEDGIRNIKLDLKNIQKQIYPCDEAVGYQRRLKRNADS